MEWCVPLQKLEVTKIVLGNLQIKPHRETKPIAPLGYIDGAMVMPVLTVLLPHLVVDSYNSADGRLILLLDSQQSIGKLTSIQTGLITSLTNSQHTWFGTRKYSESEINDFFQPMIDGNKLQLYCPSTLLEKRKGSGVIKLWKEGTWVEGVRPGLFVAGQKIRVALQIQGISLQLTGDSVWTGRSRLQHRILGIFLQTPKPTTTTASSEVPKHSLQ
jgi:hypothetical protein